MALDLHLRAAFARSVRDVEATSEAGGDPSHKLLLAQRGKRGLEVAFRLLRKARVQVRRYLLAILLQEGLQQNFSTPRRTSLGTFLRPWILLLVRLLFSTRLLFSLAVISKV